MSYLSKQERFELEKAFHNACLEGAELDPLLHRNLQNRGDFYGEVDADRIPRKGILKFSAEFDYAKQSEFIPEERVGRDGKKYIANTSDQIPSGAIFVGEFVDGKPANVEYRWCDEIIKISSDERGVLQEAIKRSPSTQQWQKETFASGARSNTQFFSDTHEFSSDGARFVEFIEKRIKPITPPQDFTQFAGVVEKFSELRASHEELRNQTVQSLSEGIKRTSVIKLNQKLEEELKQKKLPISSTQILELSGVRSEEEKTFLDQTIKGFNRVRFGEIVPDFAKADFENFPYDPSYGNCLEYARNTQSKAIWAGLPQTFVIQANPDHIFNAAIVEDKMLLIDHWNGDLICELTPEKFAEHASLHGMYELRLHACNWKDNWQQGPLDGNDAGVNAAQTALETKLGEINDSRFDLKVQEIMFTRLSQKISTLDPNDLYFQENAKELKNIADHFGLTEMQDRESGQTLDGLLLDQFCNNYDIHGFAARNAEKNGSGIWHVADDLFAKDRENPEAVIEAIQRRVAVKDDLSQVIQGIKENTLSALDLAATDRQVDLNGDEATRSFAERIRPSKNKSENSQSSAGDLAKSSLFADRFRSKKAGSVTSKER